MLKGLYSAASGMTAQQVATDNMADNLANVSTVGFKRRSTVYQSFPQLLLNKVQKGAEEETSVGGYSPGTAVQATRIDFSQGSLQQTGNPLDVALQGDGFFMLELPDGQTGYTRNGSFTRDEEGYLTSQTGAFVLDASGSRIQLTANMLEVQISANGAVGSPTTGEVARLGIAQFQNVNTLEKLGDSTFLANGQRPQVQAATGRTTLEQGYLEQSNTNVVWEMMQSITGTRHYEALQKSIQQQNETLGKAINEVGRL